MKTLGMFVDDWDVASPPDMFIRDRGVDRRRVRRKRLSRRKKNR